MPKKLSQKAIEAQLKQAYENGHDAGYAKGYADGYNAALVIYWQNMQALNDRLFTLYCTISFVQGAITTSFGNIAQETLRELGGKIGDAATQLEFEVSRIEEETGTSLGADLTEVIQYKDALKAMYDGTDPQGDQLRKLTANHHPFHRRNIEIVRPQFKPGVGKQDAITWLCEQVDNICNSEDCSQPDAAEILYLRLSNGQQAGIELTGFEKLREWEKGKTGDYVENLLRNYRRWKRT